MWRSGYFGSPGNQVLLVRGVAQLCSPLWAVELVYKRHHKATIEFVIMTGIAHWLCALSASRGPARRLRLTVLGSKLQADWCIHSVKTGSHGSCAALCVCLAVHACNFVHKQHLSHHPFELDTVEHLLTQLHKSKLYCGSCIAGSSLAVETDFRSRRLSELTLHLMQESCKRSNVQTPRPLSVNIARGRRSYEPYYTLKL